MIRNIKSLSNTVHLKNVRGGPQHSACAYCSSTQMLINNKDEMVLGLTDSFTTFISSKDCYALMSCTVCIGIASLVSGMSTAQAL